MKLSRLLFAAGLLTAGLLATPGAAQPPGKDKDKTRADYIADLTTAANLIQFGRGEVPDQPWLTGVKSPEALVAAGGILLRAHKAFEEKMGELPAPTDKDGKALKAEAKAASLKSQAGDLFVEAQGMVAGDKSRAAAIDALIKKAENLGEFRDAVGGPRNITMTILPGQSHNYKVQYVAGLPASVALTSNGGRLDFEIVNNAGESIFDIKGTFANYSWNPKNGPNRVVTFNITNIGRVANTYTLTTN
jgi:hypothetical protein